MKPVLCLAVLCAAAHVAAAPSAAQPPAGGPRLPYVSSIRVVAADDAGPICPNDSIRVLFEGVFPNDCFRVRALRLRPSPRMTPLPEPPIVELVIDDGGCLEVLCRPSQESWHASITMPPLPSRDYGLIVHAGVSSCSETFPPESLHTAIVPFLVVPADVCTLATRPCFLAGWDHSAGTGECDAFVGRGHPALVHFKIAPQVALAGLQGRFEVFPAGLRITGIEPEGPAEGMRLTWSATPEGARFVLFAKEGAPIPESYPEGRNLLRVTLESGRITVPRRTSVIHAGLLASDVEGGAVGERPIRTLDIRAEAAVICADATCDANRDGATDVRDLILMLRCLRGTGACPDSAVFDCNADGLLDRDDVLCCARRILIDRCHDCPADSSRAEPGVAVRFDAPIPVQDGIELPLVISGVDRVGGTTLRIAYPDRRFVVTGVGVDAEDWIELHDVVDGRLVVGLLRSGEAAGEARVTLRLALAAGQSSGGEVRVQDAEFSGPDGVRLIVPGATPALRLGATGVALTAPRPNPASGETRFTLAVDAQVRVDVAIHDLAGRRVATLARGTLPAGEHSLAWDGRGGGGRLGGGVYFVRAEVDGRVLTRRLVLLGRR